MPANLVAANVPVQWNVLATPYDFRPSWAGAGTVVGGQGGPHSQQHQQ